VDGDDWEYRSLEDLLGEFTLMDKNVNHDPLRQHRFHYAEKTIGVFMSMNRNEEAEMTHLKDHSKLFADQIRTFKCSKNAALYIKILDSDCPMTDRCTAATKIVSMLSKQRLHIDLQYNT